MSSIPPVPPAIASAAGAIGSGDRNASPASSSAAAGGKETAIEASSEGSDRDADGRDLREHKRRRGQQDRDEILAEIARQAEEDGDLNILA